MAAGRRRYMYVCPGNTVKFSMSGGKNLFTRQEKTAMITLHKCYEKITIYVNLVTGSGCPRRNYEGVFRF